MSKTPDSRLIAIADMVGSCDICADIGTDHALVPCLLIKRGAAKRCVATDVKKGPLKRAEEKIREEGLAGKIKLILGDGIEPALRYNPDVIIVAGMGGELISELLWRASGLIPRKQRFVLQPMSRPERLRAYLAHGGFDIKDEFITEKSSGRLFQIISAEYDGRKRRISAVEAMIGKVNIRRADKMTYKLASYELYRLMKKQKGLQSVGADLDKRELGLKENLKKIIVKCGEENEGN